MACSCIICADCKGTGNVWYSFNGKYLGMGRCDDLDEMETCDTCGGDGVEMYCDECIDAMEEEQE